MTKENGLTFSGPDAEKQYRMLMLLFRFAVINRYLYGIITRRLAKRFSQENAVSLPLETGEKFKIYLNDAYWTRFALLNSGYEEEVGQVIKNAEGFTDTFCDLGANKGYWSVFAAPLFDRVLAVEASSKTYNSLTENTSALKNVSRRWAAVFSKSNEELTFVNIHNSHASARLGEESNAGDTTETVETVAIDDLLPAKSAALIKLDVEGAEIAAIDGARRALMDGSVLIYEDHGSDARCAPSAHLLTLPDIQLFSIEEGLKPLMSVEEVRAQKTDSYKGYNFLAGHKNSPLLKSIVRGFANP